MENKVRALRDCADLDSRSLHAIYIPPHRHHRHSRAKAWYTVHAAWSPLVNAHANKKKPSVVHARSADGRAGPLAPTTLLGCHEGGVLRGVRGGQTVAAVYGAACLRKGADIKRRMQTCLCLLDNAAARGRPKQFSSSAWHHPVKVARRRPT